MQTFLEFFFLVIITCLALQINVNFKMSRIFFFTKFKVSVQFILLSPNNKQGLGVVHFTALAPLRVLSLPQNSQYFIYTYKSKWNNALPYVYFVSQTLTKYLYVHPFDIVHAKQTAPPHPQGWMQMVDQISFRNTFSLHTYYEPIFKLHKTKAWLIITTC